MPDAGVKTRRAGTGDVAKLVGSNRALFREDAGRRDPLTNRGWPEEEGRGYSAGFVTRGRGLCLLAESSGRAIGYLAGYVKRGTSLRPVSVAELESVYVEEKHRSRGLGRRLVDEFSQWAKAQGAKRASVTAYAANGRAIRFYRRSGFRPRSLSLETGIG